jgi:putative polyhydroxyalkanoate system protein
MSKINIERDHGLASADEAKALVGPVEEKLKERYGVTLVWTGNNAKIKGVGVSGHFNVDDTKILVEIKLGLLLRPMARKIEAGIARALDRHINK